MQKKNTKKTNKQIDYGTDMDVEKATIYPHK